MLEGRCVGVVAAIRGFAAVGVQRLGCVDDLEQLRGTSIMVEPASAVTGRQGQLCRIQQHCTTVWLNKLGGQMVQCRFQVVPLCITMLLNIDNASWG